MEPDQNITDIINRIAGAYLTGTVRPKQTGKTITGLIFMLQDGVLATIEYGLHGIQCLAYKKGEL